MQTLYVGSSILVYVLTLGLAWNQVSSSFHSLSFIMVSYKLKILHGCIINALETIYILHGGLGMPLYCLVMIAYFGAKAFQTRGGHNRWPLVIYRQNRFILHARVATSSCVSRDVGYTFLGNEISWQKNSFPKKYISLHLWKYIGKMINYRRCSKDVF